MRLVQPANPSQEPACQSKAPRELAFISQHSFIQRTILHKGKEQQSLRTQEGIGILGFCGRNFPFFFQKSIEGKNEYPLVTQWTDPYRSIGASPAGPIFAGYVQGGWANGTLTQWQQAHQIPSVLFLLDSFVCHPCLETIGFPLSTSEIAAQIDSFTCEVRGNSHALTKSVYIS
jgi:hypothetical protein